MTLHFAEEKIVRKRPTGNKNWTMAAMFINGLGRNEQSL
jgi:hypothetical protein